MHCYNEFIQLYKREPADTVFCPYRICPIGAHSDHQLGKITGLAVDQGIHMAYRPKRSGIIEVYSLNFPIRAQWHINSIPEECEHDWADYLRGATWVLGKRYPLQMDDDMLVIVGDNVQDFSLTRRLSYAWEKNSIYIIRYYEGDEKKLRKCGLVEIDEQDRIVSMEEKPAHPKSNRCCPLFCFYTREDARLVAKGIEAGCGTDALGSYIAWRYKQTPVHAKAMPGKRFGVSNLESYNKIKNEYEGITC